MSTPMAAMPVEPEVKRCGRLTRNALNRKVSISIAIVKAGRHCWSKGKVPNNMKRSLSATKAQQALCYRITTETCVLRRPDRANKRPVDQRRD